MLSSTVMHDARSQDRRQRRGIVLLTILCEGGLCGLAWLFAYWWDVPLWQSLSWNTGDLLLGMLSCVPLLVFFFVCLRWPVGPLQSIKRFCRDIIVPLFRPCTWYELAAIAFMAGVGEETLFRGVLQVVLSRWLGLATALVVVSALFGLLHLITPAYALLAGLMGFYLGWLWIATGTLTVPVVAHGLYDFVALFYLVRAPGMPAPVNPTEP